MDKNVVPYLLTEQRPQSDRLPIWLILLMYLAYLHATQPRHPTEVVVLRTLILVVGLVLTVVAVVAAGAPEVIVEVVKHWPSLP